MKLAHALPSALAATTISVPAWAAQDDSHHPAAAVTAPSSKAMPGKPGLQIVLSTWALAAGAVFAWVLQLLTH